MKHYPISKCSLSNFEELTYRESENREQTKKRQLLLLHGNMSSSIHFQTLMEELESDFHIIAPDLPGFGDSTYNKEYNSLEDFAIVIKEFVTALNIDAFDVLGWSTGGGIALELAYLLPEKVEKVYLLSSVGLKGYPMYKKDKQMQPILTERLVEKEDIAQDPVQVLPVLDIYANKDTEAMRLIWNYSIYTQSQPPEEEYKQYLNEIMKQRNLVDIDYSLVHFNMTDESNGVAEGTGRMADIQAPIVIIHGENDLVVPVADAQEAKEAFGDQASLHIIQGAGHAIVQDNMKQLVEIINNGGI